MADEDAYTKSTAELDLERRIEENFESPNKIDWGTVPSQVTEDGYVNTDPIYQNAATPGGEPHWAQEGALKTIEEKVLGDEVAALEADAEDDEEESDDEDEGAQQPEPQPETPQPSLTPPVNS